MFQIHWIQMSPAFKGLEEQQWVSAITLCFQRSMPLGQPKYFTCKIYAWIAK